MPHLFAILMLALLGWFWLDSLRAREIAFEICKYACTQRAVQLLDQTVALRRIGIAWRAEGIRLRRTYGFDFSADGAERYSGMLVLRGVQLESLVFETPQSLDER